MRIRKSRELSAAYRRLPFVWLLPNQKLHERKAFVMASAALARDFETFSPPVDLELDPGIRRYVLVLRSSGIETYESCEGGEGHAFPEPTVRFWGNNGEGFKALSIAMTYGLPVLALRRAWRVDDGELTGPWWEMTFRTRG